jgi:hypothetical protein
MSNLKTTIQIEKEKIEEAKKHPLWSKFRESYMESTKIDPEDSAVPVLVMSYWKICLAGNKATLDKMQKDLIESTKRV